MGKDNKIVFAIVVAGFLIAGAIVFVFDKDNADKNASFETSQNSGKNQVLPESENAGFKNSLNCKNIPDMLDNSEKLVTKIIDGDTFLIEGGYSVRLLGIDADEKDHPCYLPAKNRLEELVLNKKIILEKGIDDLDIYCRYLRFPILNGQNISLQIVKEGLVVARFFPQDVKYRAKITEAENYARETKTGCKWQKQ